MFWSLARIGLAVVVGVPLFVYLLQEKLLFYPQPLGKPINVPNVDEVAIKTEDGVTLRGWLVKSNHPLPAPLVIYFGGNAEEVSWLASVADQFGGWSLLLVNYRGYGGSEGKPGERELFGDALSIYDWAVGRSDVLPGHVIAMGRSLGTGVAVHLAANRALRGVILVTPYDSITDIAKRHYPYLPVGMLIRHPFDSISRVDKIDAPLLCLAAAEDLVIPPKHARRLYDAWRGPKTWREIADAGHDSISGDPAYWEAIGAFLKDLR
jgi:pimeloyl-ACP methyl ester carboxylesterase